MSCVDIILLICLAILSIWDIKKKMIPVIPIVLTGILLAGYRLWTGVGLIVPGLGLLPGIVLLIAALCTKESIGYGDGLVFCMIGIGCGVQKTMAVLGLSLLAAALTAMVVLVTRKGNRKTKLPFLPCILLGYLLCLIQ